MRKFNKNFIGVFEGEDKKYGKEVLFKDIVVRNFL